ncbi:YihY/virulence factor BrkB family protein [Clostridium sp. 'deep sea']|uniref:YihY/virulence factor BrkB family protein n=1 Tax=Clostridium sp. 'deep sea' TaxID=2779445 RepID=UPI001896798C|nr:YihY/virulence factor BrkB family protein [Clostridium sp. 'deep sea']QOR34476.1 YihY/virulence factor BrkB family protein [Clostridium sp. 'deep sea']
MKKNFFSEIKFKNKYIKAIITFWQKIYEDELFSLGAQTSYYLILAMIPFISLAVFITSSNQDVIDATLKFLYFLLPAEAYNFIYSLIKETINASTSTLFSASVIVAFYLPMRAVVAIIYVLNKAYKVKETRSIFTVWGLAFFITLLFIPSIAVVLSTQVFGRLISLHVFSLIGISQWFNPFWNIIRYVFSIVILLLFFMIIYRYLPNHHVAWRETIPGAFFSTFGWLIASLGFAYYVNNYNNYDVAYGSLAGIFILLIWLYMSSTIILCGGELNALISKRKQSVNKI